MITGVTGDTSGRKPGGWLVYILVGAVVGALVGIIAAVNFVIYVGIEGGYEATLPEVFAQSPIAGMVTVAILLAGPIVGVLAARRLRRQRRSAVG